MKTRVWPIVLVVIVLSTPMFLIAAPAVLAQATETPTPTPTPFPTATPGLEPTPGQWLQSYQQVQEGGGLEPYPYDPNPDSPLQGVAITFETVWTAVRTAFTTYIIVRQGNILPILLVTLLALVAMTLVFRLLTRPPEI